MRVPMLSADSHVIESLDLWDGLIPDSYWSPSVKQDAGHHPGGQDPHARVGEMEVDGVSGEVLYPTFGLSIYALEDPELQAACCRRYNDWLAEYCAAAPERLYGIGMVPTYDMDTALAELAHCQEIGMRGTMIWQTPHPDLPFSTDHYERFWAASAASRMPVSLHIITGFNYSRALMTTSEAPAPTPATGTGNRGVYNAVRQKLDCVIDALSDIVFSDVFARHPELRLVLVENEVGWLPFVLDQWDYYARGKREADDPAVPPRDMWPSDYVSRNVFVTFFRDGLVSAIDGWGHDNCMWSNDYPHPNSTWPHSRNVVDRMLGGLPDDDVQKLTWRNAARLYGLESVFAPVPASS